MRRIKVLALERGKEQAVLCAAQEALWEVAAGVLESSDMEEAIGVWRRKQQEWVGLCRQDPEIKTCVLKRLVRVISSELCDLLDSHGVWK